MSFLGRSKKAIKNSCKLQKATASIPNASAELSKSFFKK